MSERGIIGATEKPFAFSTVEGESSSEDDSFEIDLKDFSLEDSDTAESSECEFEATPTPVKSKENGVKTTVMCEVAEDFLEKCEMVELGSEAHKRPLGPQPEKRWKRRTPKKKCEMRKGPVKKPTVLQRLIRKGRKKAPGLQEEEVPRAQPDDDDVAVDGVPSNDAQAELERLMLQLRHSSPRMTFSVNLIQSCETLLQWIAEFGGREDLHAPAPLERSLVRYELFLALFCSVAHDKGEEEAMRLVPPIDVAHVWRAHLIRPLTYRKDCTELFGRQIPPSVMFSDLFVAISDAEGVEQATRRAAAIAKTKESWERMVTEEDIPEMPFEPSADVSEELPPSEISIGVPHLTEDLSWWTCFRDNWGREYESNREAFLLQRQEQYAGFLKEGACTMLEKQANPHKALSLAGPPVDVDLFWHCHMMFADDYDRHMESVGYVFYHQPAADPKDWE